MRFRTTSDRHKHWNRKSETDSPQPEARQPYASREADSKLHLIVEIGPPPASDESSKWRMLADKVLGPADELEQQTKPEIDFHRWLRSA